METRTAALILVEWKLDCRRATAHSPVRPPAARPGVGAVRHLLLVGHGGACPAREVPCAPRWIERSDRRSLGSAETVCRGGDEPRRCGAALRARRPFGCSLPAGR